MPIAAALAFAAWFYIAPEGALGKLDAIGYAVCHRIGARSFHIGRPSTALCARCTGEFFSAAIGLVFMGFVSGKRSKLPVAQHHGSAHSLLPCLRHRREQFVSLSY